ncbi:hypothetical protein PANO111632_20560 [Paracoccus nototheniae]|uniref:Uncharacterized protein n=1 Tax=Paracoccus nototheniae TaxID=2489002 RepID=A0ABW4DS60_9RHOB|nr:hypothetical protein [Paracoccus nototheniae]
MIQAAHHQADAYGEPLTALRFVTDAYGPLMTVRIGDEVWHHDGTRFDLVKPDQQADDDYSPRP